MAGGSTAGYCGSWEWMVNNPKLKRSSKATISLSTLSHDTKQCGHNAPFRELRCVCVTTKGYFLSGRGQGCTSAKLLSCVHARDGYALCPVL